jgi:hypothetical protein
VDVFRAYTTSAHRIAEYWVKQAGIYLSLILCQIYLFLTTDADLKIEVRLLISLRTRAPDDHKYPTETGDPEGEPQESRVLRLCLRVACIYGPIATAHVGALVIYQYFMDAPSSTADFYPRSRKFFF